MLWTTFQAESQENSDSVKITVKNMGVAINSSAFDEYAPIISADGLMMIFTSRRPVFETSGEKGAQELENIYVSYYDENINRWKEAKMLGKTINQPGKNNSAIALSNDGQRLLVYRGDPDGNIYESVLKGEEWSEPIKMPEPINSDGHESSASISPDGRTIYFISDRKGGQGGLDIWLCRQDNMGNWGKAENLGPTINTSKNEEGVFIHPDGKTLYFSSKGHNSTGGYDIFKSVFEKGEWSTPVNLGTPINTPKDDMFFVLTADGKTGYYSSSLQGNSEKKDIFEITFDDLRQKKNEPRITLFKGVIIDNDTKNPLGTSLEITDNIKNEVIANLKSNSATGQFLVSLPAGKNYGITIKKEGYLFYSENFNIPNSAAFKGVYKRILLRKIKENNSLILKNVFYDSGKSTLSPESISELNQLIKLLNASSSIKIEIASYTDNVGSDKFNLPLSQARAQSVFDFLYAAGISKDQMVPKGYGASAPIATNYTEEGSQQNRRTEIKILEK